MNNLKYIIIGLAFLILPLSCVGQFLETRQAVGFDVGYGVLNGNDDNLFFPSSANQSGLVVNFDYTHKVASWIAGGVSLGYNYFSSPHSSSDFARIRTFGSNFISVGPCLLLHSPFRTDGFFNRFSLGFTVTPQFHYYFGERSLHIDNEVYSVDGNNIVPIIEMNSASSGFGVKLCPAMVCRITQRLGLQLSYQMQWLNVYTGFDKEHLVANSISGGVVYTFGNNKGLF